MPGNAMVFIVQLLHCRQLIKLPWISVAQLVGNISLMLACDDDWSVMSGSLFAEEDGTDDIPGWPGLVHRLTNDWPTTFKQLTARRRDGKCVHWVVRRDINNRGPCWSQPLTFPRLVNSLVYSITGKPCHLYAYIWYKFSYPSIHPSICAGRGERMQQSWVTWVGPKVKSLAGQGFIILVSFSYDK